MKFQCVGVQQLVERGRKICVGEECVFPFHQKSTMGGVCVEAWTDSPASPLPKQLTAITSLSYQQKLLTEGGWNKTKEDDTWVFHPFGSRFDNSPPRILILGKIMTLSIQLPRPQLVVFILIIDAYLHDDQHNICRMPRYTIGDKFKSKTQHNRSMVGPWPLTPHHDHLQYTHHIHLM